MTILQRWHLHAGVWVLLGRGVGSSKLFGASLQQQQQPQWDDPDCRVLPKQDIHQYDDHCLTPGAPSPKDVCCNIAPTNFNYLRLPILNAEHVVVHVSNVSDINANANTSNNDAGTHNGQQAWVLHQGRDTYDPSAVLWPSSYLLALHLASQQNDDDSVVELGAGLGLPSLVVSSTNVLATDRATAALERMERHGVATQALDYLDADAVQALVEEHGRFDLVLGSSLIVPNGSDNFQRLADSLDRLLAPQGRVLLSQADPPPPLDGFVVVDFIPANVYGMTTRWDDDDSLFEFGISILQRRHESRVDEL